MDFRGYWLNPTLTSQQTHPHDVKNSNSDRNYVPEARIYILGSKGWVGIYCARFENVDSPEIFCIKEIELETGSKVRAVKFDISEPQVIGNWENEAGYSPFKGHINDQINPDMNITYEQ